MNLKINYQIILAVGISLTFIACNQNEKQNEETKITDSSGNTKMDTAEAAGQNTPVDAVKSAPDLYSVLCDSLGIRVLKVTYKPGDSSALHVHPDYAVYAIDDATAEFTGKDGKKNVTELKAGTISVRPEELHSVKNTGKTTLKVILVEVNRPRGTMSPGTAMDAAKVAPALYKVAADTLGIRVLEVTYKPGESSAMHEHPDNAIYVLSGGTTEFTEKDGTKHTNESKTGTAFIGPAGVHSVKNIGKTTVKILLVEVNRPKR